MWVNLFNGFRENEAGNVGAMFAIMTMPTLVLMGGAVDLLRVSNSQAKLQAAVESGVLSAASLTNTQAVEDVVNEYVNANVGDDPAFQNLKITVTNQSLALNKRVVEVKAEAEVPMIMMQLIGNKAQKIEVSAEALEARQAMELAMVLDVSSSMNGNRLKNLKTAAADFVDQMLSEKRKDYTSISLVPFGGTVNIGALFDDYAATGAGVIQDPSSSQYNLGYKITENKFRFTNGGKCVELRKEDFNLDAIADQSRSQVPNFWKYVNFNPWCPDDKSAAIWNTNNATNLKDRIEEFTLSDGTGMDHGLLWGAKSLAPSFKGKLGGDFPDRPQAFSTSGGDVQKIMVLMTDGGITFQGRPKDYTYLSVHKSGKNNKNEQTLLSRGNMKNTPGQNTAIGNYKAVCDDLAANGVTIYTIGFQIKKNSLPEQLMQYCATNPANYYLVESLDIAQAFNAIAISVQKLRVSG